jgi:hypothetical protein
MVKFRPIWSHRNLFSVFVSGDVIAKLELEVVDDLHLESIL